MQRAWRFLTPIHELIKWQLASEPGRDWTYCLRSSEGKRVEIKQVKKSRCEWCPHFIPDEKAPAVVKTARAPEKGNVKFQQGKLY